MRKDCNIEGSFLERRQVRGHLIMHGVDKIDNENLSFPSENTTTTGNPMTLNLGRIRTDNRNLFYIICN